MARAVAARILEADGRSVYAKARSGAISHFTGVSDPYEVPGDAHLSIDSSDGEPAEAAGKVLGLLV